MTEHRYRLLANHLNTVNTELSAGHCFSHETAVQTIHILQDYLSGIQEKIYPESSILMVHYGLEKNNLKRDEYITDVDYKVQEFIVIGVIIDDEDN